MENILYFVDIEATGLDLVDDRIIQLAFLKVQGSKLEAFNDLCYTDIQMSETVMSVHNITNLMLKDKFWPYETDGFMELEKANNENNYFISHGNELDVKMLENEELDLVMKCIDTDKCARHIFKDSQSYKLEDLIKHYSLSSKADVVAKKIGLSKITAHDALSDALWHYVLFEFLLEKVSGDIDTLVKITSEPLLLEVISFGKYKNKTFEEIFKTDPLDFVWMYVNLAQDWMDLEYTLTYWLRTKEHLFARAKQERGKIFPR
ncbi:3'-5' exonuclease [Sulfurimonas sp. SAG-AH-194-I05]|nr:3'-5' exonuclease [Sulfurimonas sp. SAG-AH-194-I05]MDF1875673.1 3'-5' exonuclease [Sulfurimonas sp. SAG-AH-194-I05]